MRKSFSLLLSVALAVTLFTQASPVSAHHSQTTQVSCGDQANTNNGIRLERTTLSGEQVGNARLIMGVAAQRNLPESAAEVAIVASLQSSSLRNASRNERGLFQQVPRYYPGVAITDPAASTSAFFDGLTRDRNWRSRSLADSARRTQGARSISAFRKWEPLARALTQKWWSAKGNPTDCTVQAIVGSGVPSVKAPLSQTPATTTKRTTSATTPPPILATSNPALVRVGGITVSKQIGSQLQGLLHAASKDGLRLTGSGWRDPNRQIALRRQNCGTSRYAVYHKSPSLCSPPTARPGTSNHERGLAVDFRNCSTRNTACYKWLKKNASTYGLKNLPSEPWHWSTNGR